MTPKCMTTRVVYAGYESANANSSKDVEFEPTSHMILRCSMDMILHLVTAMLYSCTYRSKLLPQKAATVSLVMAVAGVSQAKNQARGVQPSNL